MDLYDLLQGGLAGIAIPNLLDDSILLNAVSDLNLWLVKRRYE